MLIACGIVSIILILKKSELLAYKFKDRIIVLGIGVGSYFFAMLLWHLMFNREEIALWATYAALGMVFISAFACIPFKSTSKVMETLKWNTSIVTVMIGIVIIILLLVIPSYHHSPFGAETFEELPENFPRVLTPPDYANEASFTNFSQLNSYAATYGIPENGDLNELNDYLKEIHEQYGYTYLKHDCQYPIL